MTSTHQLTRERTIADMKLQLAGGFTDDPDATKPEHRFTGRRPELCTYGGVADYAGPTLGLGA